MKIGFGIFFAFVALVGVLIFRFETPTKRERRGLTGRGGDFES